MLDLVWRSGVRSRVISPGLSCSARTKSDSYCRPPLPGGRACAGVRDDHARRPLARVARPAAGRPYPCQGHQCGCRSAEECWSHCCCFTPSQRLAWAAANRVDPPAELNDALLAEDDADPSGPPGGRRTFQTRPRPSLLARLLPAPSCGEGSGSGRARGTKQEDPGAWFRESQMPWHQHAVGDQRGGSSAGGPAGVEF